MRPDPRDRLIDAALSVAALDIEIRDLTRRMRALRCQSGPPDDPPCWHYPEEPGYAHCPACKTETRLFREPRRPSGGRS
jgi:hypothetical protein